MTMEGLTNWWMHDFLECITLQDYAGIYSSDNIPMCVLMRRNFSIICNLSQQGEKGTHFTTICRRNNSYFLVDSIGLTYETLPTALKEIVPRNIGIVHPKPLQPILSNACGFYCIQFVLQYDSNINARNIKSFSFNVEENDEICIYNIITMINNNETCGYMKNEMRNQ